MGDIEERGIDASAQFDQFRAHLVAQLGIQIGEGFVHQEYLRVPDDGPPDVQFPAADLL